MPRPAPTRRHAASPPPSALPQRTAATVGPDGWLRLPPQHQRMHPVDVLVDGVLAALDGTMRVTPTALDRYGFAYSTDDITFLRLPLSDRFHEGIGALEDARRRLKREVDRLMGQAALRASQEVQLVVSRTWVGGERAREDSCQRCSHRQQRHARRTHLALWERQPLPTHAAWCAQVRHQAAQVHPTADRLATEESLFVVRTRERSKKAAKSKAHAWELVQLASSSWACQQSVSEGTLSTKVRKVLLLNSQACLFFVPQAQFGCAPARGCAPTR